VPLHQHVIEQKLVLDHIIWRWPHAVIFLDILYFAIFWKNNLCWGQLEAVGAAGTV
jgi:hypothetical protein